MTPLTRTIEVDFDVHQRIEAARRGFNDLPNAVLRRLLGIDRDDTDNQSFVENPVEAPPTHSGASWAKQGVQLYDGTELRVEYAEVVAHGRVSGGRLVFNGAEYDSPSRAAMEVVRERRETPVNINGWKHLFAREPIHGSWESLDQLRDRQLRLAN